MSGGRISSFLAGAGAGAFCYYASDSYMLADLGRAEARARELRDELVGVVAAPVKEAGAKVRNTLLSPLQSSDVSSTWNSGVQTALGAVSDVFSKKST